MSKELKWKRFYDADGRLVRHARSIAWETSDYNFEYILKKVVCVDGLSRYSLEESTPGLLPYIDINDRHEYATQKEAMRDAQLMEDWQYTRKGRTPLK